MRTAWRRAQAWPRRIGPREAESLLTGGPVGADHRGLEDLLSAVAGPAQPHELRGGQAPLAVFMQAPDRYASHRSRVRRRPVIVKLLTGGLSAKLAAAIAVFTLGAAGVAAETGVLPAPAQQVAHDWFAGVGVPPPPAANPEPRDDDEEGDDRRPTPAPSASEQEDHEEAVSKCREYTQAQGRTLDPTLAQHLAKLAGAAAKVDQFCARVLTENDDSAKKSDPSPSPSEDGDQ